MDTDQTRKLKAFEFLCDNRFGVLSTVSLQNKPEAAMVYYVVEEKNIYFVTTSISRKVRNISTNERAALAVFSEIPPLEIQIEGRAEVVSDLQLKKHIAGLYLEKSNKNPDTINWPPVLKLPNLDGFAFIKMSVDWFKFSDFREVEGTVVEGSSDDWE